MKNFGITIQSIIIDNISNNIVKTFDTDFTIYAFDRSNAVLTALDMGQAMARGMNHTQGAFGMFFKVISIVEKKN